MPIEVTKTEGQIIQPEHNPTPEERIAKLESRVEELESQVQQLLEAAKPKPLNLHRLTEEGMPNHPADRVKLPGGRRK